MAKNSEVYKTAQERAEAFQEFLDYMCNKQRCSGCKLRPCGLPYERAFAWLDLEADEEKPETIEDIVDEMRLHTRVSAADAFYGVTEWTKLCDRIIAAHNRVAKKCREVK